jgi:hypothetical protein
MALVKDGRREMCRGKDEVGVGAVEVSLVAGAAGIVGVEAIFHKVKALDISRFWGFRSSKMSRK